MLIPPQSSVVSKSKSHSTALYVSLSTVQLSAPPLN